MSEQKYKEVPWRRALEFWAADKDVYAVYRRMPIGKDNNIRRITPAGIFIADELLANVFNSPTDYTFYIPEPIDYNAIHLAAQWACFEAWAKHGLLTTLKIESKPNGLPMIHGEHGRVTRVGESYSINNVVITRENFRGAFPDSVDVRKFTVRIAED